MCGFLGEVSFNNNLSDLKKFKSLLHLSIHRGPDDTQILEYKNIRLGFNRLAILDLTDKGSQPKQSPTKRYQVVFNGEIYNYKQLAKLHRINNLDSTSDTEVLVHLFDKIGVDKTVRQLNGMFAIMVLDTTEDITYLIRDFAGIKPLFYGLSNNSLVAASQFNQIYRHPDFSNNLVLRPDVVKAYFGLGYMLAPDTIYKSINQVKQGEYLKFKNNKIIEVVNYKAFNKKVSNFKRVTVNERVRDINFKDNKLYLFLEDTASIGIVSLN